MHSNIKPAASPFVPGSAPNVVKISNPRNPAQFVNVNVDDLLKTMITAYPGTPEEACQRWSTIDYGFKQAWVRSHIQTDYKVNYATIDAVNRIVGQLTDYCQSVTEGQRLNFDSRPISDAPVTTPTTTPNTQNPTNPAASQPAVLQPVPASPWSVPVVLGLGGLAAFAYWLGTRSRAKRPS